MGLLLKLSIKKLVLPYGALFDDCSRSDFYSNKSGGFIIPIIVQVNKICKEIAI